MDKNPWFIPYTLIDQYKLRTGVLETHDVLSLCETPFKVVVVNPIGWTFDVCPCGTKQEALILITTLEMLRTHA